MNRLLQVLFTLATILFVGLITPGLAADQNDGKYYAEDKNEDDVVWKLYLKVANNEVSASVNFEECNFCVNDGDRSPPLDCGSAKLNTKIKFEFWCEVPLVEGASGPPSDPARNTWAAGFAGDAESKIISHSELAEFNRFEVDTGIHKTSAYLDEN